MIPDNRLAILLDHVKQNQINQCLYHNTANPPSLYSDHMCDRKDFPLRTEIQLTEQRDEVWWCSFSHDGTRLVTACKDSTVILYDTDTFTVLHTLKEHTDGVVHCEFSPDDSKLITCSQDKTARVWSVEVNSPLNALLPFAMLTRNTDRPLSVNHKSSSATSNVCSMGSRRGDVRHGFS